MREHLNDRLVQIHLLKVKAKLGDLPEAQAIADLDVRVASDKRHRSRPVEWFGTEAGRWTARLRPAPDGGEHLTVCPG